MNSALQAQNTYRNNSVLSAAPEQLVLMLYDGTMRFLGQALVAMNEAIIDELRGTLDYEAGELAERLDAIYLFCRQLLVEAQLEQDPAKIESVSSLIGELREAWAAICP